MIDTYAFKFDHEMTKIFHSVSNRALKNGATETAMTTLSIAHAAFYAPPMFTHGDIIQVTKESYENICKIMDIYRSEDYISLKEI